MSLISRPFRRALLGGCALLALAGCSGGLSELGFDTKMAVGSVSLLDRCSDFMHRAYPQEGITVSDTHVATNPEDTVVAIAGVRSGVAANSTYARNVGVECRFEGGILTGFRWTAGPLRPGADAQVP